MSGRGGVGFAVVTQMPFQAEIDGLFWQREPAGYAGGIGKEPARRKALGFIFVRLPVPGPRQGWAVAVPLWAVLLPAAAVPAWHFWGGPRRERRRHEKLGLCLRCGYDLRASAGRCPECGEPVAAAGPTLARPPRRPQTRPRPRMSDPPAPPSASLPRRLGRRAVPFVTIGTVSLLLLGATGQVLRDRNVLLALMMYVPLLPVGLWAVALDLARRGRSVPRLRFALTVAGVAAAAWGAFLMAGTRAPEPAAPGSTEVSILQWNVMWGGDNPAQWSELAREISRRSPDLIVLSEAPSDDMVTRAFSRLTRPAHVVYITNPPGTGYWYNPMVCSGGPLKLERRVEIRNGAAMSVLAEVRGRSVRLLVVDGKSDPRILRTPMLHDIAAACGDAARRGEPVDVIVGDFNSMGRSIGFDAVAGAGGLGYRRAAQYAGWRATWPFPVPLYDIDHVWVRNGPRVLGCELFSSRRTDHRGQFVRLALPADR